MTTADVTAEEVLRQIGKADAPLILDVRSRAEYDAGHIPGAVNLPFWTIPFRASSLPARRGDPVVVYCGHGPRAQLALAALRLQGFTRVACLAGHWAEWRRSQRPEER